MMRNDSVHSDATEVGLLPVGTAVMWLCCIAVGIVGLRVPYPRPPAPAKQQAPVQAQIMHVELTNDASPPPDIGPAAQATPEVTQPLPPQMPEVATPPSSAPPLTAVAVPSPAIAFALPVEGPTRIVDAKEAIPTKPTPATTNAATQAATTPPTARRITFGQGEGRQPAPEYPREAALSHQQGTLIVRFTVGEDGQVQTAQAISPCPFPLLNQAAVRAVRETWRFPAGPVRAYEVSIQFQLAQR